VAQGLEVGVGRRSRSAAVTRIEAAGGVVVRRTDAGAHEAVLVHRPQYGDWTLPKGKLEPRESRLDAAVREVCEETGLHILVGPDLALRGDRRGWFRGG